MNRTIIIDGEERRFRDIGERWPGWTALLIYDATGRPTSEHKLPHWFMRTGGTIVTGGHTYTLRRRYD
jgi:hypothetical protein